MTSFEIIFDGGSRGNPGHGYGSYQIRQNGTVLTEERLTFDHIGSAITNNQAEYMTLIHALERLALERAGKLAESAVVVRGDSLLVINQVSGRWKVNNAGLRPLQQRARSLLETFGSHAMQWHERSHSVEILGH